MIKIRLDSEAYNRGCAAGINGEFSNSCPYPVLTLESLSWHSGFIEGKAKSLERLKHYDHQNAL